MQYKILTGKTAVIIFVLLSITRQCYGRDSRSYAQIDDRTSIADTRLYGRTDSSWARTVNPLEAHEREMREKDLGHRVANTNGRRQALEMRTRSREKNREDINNVRGSYRDTSARNLQPYRESEVRSDRFVVDNTRRSAKDVRARNSPERLVRQAQYNRRLDRSSAGRDTVFDVRYVSRTTERRTSEDVSRHPNVNLPTRRGDNLDYRSVRSANNRQERRLTIHSSRSVGEERRALSRDTREQVRVSNLPSVHTRSREKRLNSRSERLNEESRNSRIRNVIRLDRREVRSFERNGRVNPASYSRMTREVENIRSGSDVRGQIRHLPTIRNDRTYSTNVNREVLPATREDRVRKLHREHQSGYFERKTINHMEDGLNLENLRDKINNQTCINTLQIILCIYVIGQIFAKSTHGKIKYQMPSLAFASLREKVQ